MAPKLRPETLEERKTQILEAALTCFARKGYHQTTMDDIVREAGLSKGGLYWHFSSKKELFLSLFESLVEGFDVIMRTSLATPKSATERLGDVLEMFVTMCSAEEFERIMPLMIDVWAQNWQDADVNEVAVMIYDRYRGPIVQLVAEGIASGEFKPVNASAVASIIIAAYDGLMVQAMIDESLVDWETVNETVKSTLVAGLLVDKAPSLDSR